MTQEEKNLLLKDLCGRLPYGVKGQIEADTIVPNRYDMEGFSDETTFNVDVELDSINIGNFEISVTPFGVNEDVGEYIFEYQNCSPWGISEFKPYLRPMSSMTEEERKELYGLLLNIERLSFADIIMLGKDTISPAYDWLNAHHFDYRGLIEKGLALEAPKDMYK